MVEDDDKARQRLGMNVIGEKRHGTNEELEYGLETGKESVLRKRRMSLNSNKQARQMCEWCGMFDCEMVRRHSNPAAEAKAASARVIEETMIHILQKPKLPQELESRKEASTTTADSDQKSRAWHFVNTGSISWTNSIRRHHRKDESR